MARHLRNALLLFGVSTLAGLYFASQYMANPGNLARIDWGWALSVNLTYYWAWGATLPLVVLLARRIPLEPGHLPLRLTAHLVASIVVTVVLIVAVEATLAKVLRGMPFATSIRHGLSVNFHSYLPTYWMILAGATAFDYWKKFRDREMAAARLQARLSEARLEALRMQLDPHFLFNALNSVSSLMYTDVDRADRMISQLGDFLRLTLHGDARAMTSLEREIEFARRYLEIEQIRFEERLQVRWQIDPATLGIQVPSFLLQPLIENAVHHGISADPRGGTITISTGTGGGMLDIEVENDTVGPGSTSPHQGVGLRNTRARLEEIWGNRSSVETSFGPARGLVRVKFPVERILHAS